MKLLLPLLKEIQSANMKIQTTNSSQKFNGRTTEAKVRADSGRGRGESNGNPTGGAQECHLYLAGNRSPRFSGGNERSHNRFERENIFFHFKKNKVYYCYVSKR